MTRSAHAAVLGPLVLTLSSLLLSAPRAQADDFALFRIPDHTVSGWNGSLNGWFNRDVFNMADEQRRSRQLQGNAATSAFWQSETDTRFTFASLSFRAAGQEASSERLMQSSYAPGQLWAQLTEDSQQNASENWFAELGTRLYLWEPPVGISVRAWGRGSYDQAWLTQDNQALDASPLMLQESVQQSTRNEYRQVHQAAGEMMLGLGKVRDATGVYEAMVIEQRLRERGVIRGRLRMSTRQRIAELLYVRFDVSSTVDRPARRLWEELERALREDNAVNIDRLDAESIMRAGEGLFDMGITSDVLPRSPLLRRRGMFVGGLTQASHFRALRWGETSTYSRYTVADTVVSEFRTADSLSIAEDGDELWAGPSGEWYWPLGPRLQLDAQAAVVFALTGEDGRWNENSAIQLGWIVADRWLASINGRHARWIGPQFVGSDATGEGWSVGYGGAIRFFLEDRVAIELSGQEVQERVDYSPANPVFDTPEFYRRFASVRLGLSFNFMGQFDAPGLMRPIRI